MAHPSHEVPGARARLRGEGVARVPEIVEVESGFVQLLDGSRPVEELVEVAPPDGPARRRGEDQRRRVLTDELGRWVGLSYDGKIVTGWGAMARDERAAKDAIAELRERNGLPA